MKAKVHASVQRHPILSLLLLTLLLLGAIGWAADLTYTTLPQDTDSSLVLANKRATEAASNKYTNITTATTTAVKSGSGIIERIVVNKVGSSSTATVYDNTAGSGTKIATINTDSLGTYHYGARFGTGLTVVTVNTPDITVIYR